MSRSRDYVGVEVTRGGRVESRHRVDVAVADPSGRLIVSTAGVAEPAFARSAVKPFQALPLVADGAADRFAVTGEELALCCASHNAETRHLEVARSLLSRAGLTEDALACGPHDPLGEAAAASLRREGREPGRLHNNCSGKHAGMLLLARHRGWPTDGYHEAGHPVQDRMLEEVAGWTRLQESEIETGVDGCGVVTYALPLDALASAFARLADVARDRAAPAGRVLASMVANPFMVGGTGRLCTALGEMTGGRVVAKVGAEGVYAAAVTDRQWGVALKARDGARRAAEVALLGVLGRLGVLDDDELARLARWANPEVRNTRDEKVGEVRARVEVFRES